MQFLKLYLIALVVFFAVDLLWLGVIAKGFYSRFLGHWLAPNVNWTAAIVFYLLYIGGILYFAVWPALQQGSLGKALIAGALFGFITYATYELTNLATLKDWPLTVVLVDILWGTFLCTVVSAGTFWLANYLKIYSTIY